MVIFGATFGCALLSHSLRFHIEMNTYNSWFSGYFEYLEESNGFVLALELCKLQVYISFLSCCQDLFMNTNESFFVQQEHTKDKMFTLENNEEREIEDDYEDR